MFRWPSLLDLAGELVERTGDEAAERSAIGRAYYACYCSARRRLDPAGSRIPKTGFAHAAVWTAFHDRGDRTSRRVADRGRRLRQWRTKADYEEIYPDLTREARQAVGLAHRLLDDLGELP